MSPDETFLAQLLRALGAVQLEAIVVGSAAAAIQGVPIMTQDVDLLVRDTPTNRTKIERLCESLGGAQAVLISPLSSALSLVGPPISVDLLFDSLPGNLSFEGIRSRSVRVAIGDQEATVASLNDVIASKEAAGRPKDLAQLPILRDTLRIRQALDDE